jgi:hypothetical protein
MNNGSDQHTAKQQKRVFRPLVATYEQASADYRRKWVGAVEVGADQYISAQSCERRLVAEHIVGLYPQVWLAWQIENAFMRKVFIVNVV